MSAATAPPKGITPEQQQELDEAFARARKALAIIETYDQARVDRLCQAVAWTVANKRTFSRLVEMGIAESGLGDAESRMGKRMKIRGVLRDALRQKSVGVIEEIPEKGIVKYGKPAGIVACIVPTTNPDLTPAGNAIYAIKARDVVVYSPHPRSKKTSYETVRLMREALEREGAPADILQCLTKVNIPMSQALMARADLIIATGGQEYRGPAYGLGAHPNVRTQGDLEATLAELESGRHADHPLRRAGATIVMLQCVGPWDEDPSRSFYCSRICCSVAMKNALRIKALNPAAAVVVLHKDVRTYGFHEALYTQARSAGVVFIRIDEAPKPQVMPTESGLAIQVRDMALGQDVALQADWLVLSSALVPADGSVALAETFKFSCTLEGFFAEAHVKLRPVDFPAEGLFLCGVAHYPKTIEEAMAQARAAAARAASILSQDVLEVGGVVATVSPERCTACLTCVRICPYGAPRINPELVGAGGIQGAAEIKAAACQGCGLCVAECPAKAIQLMHYKDQQVLAKIEALLAEAGGAR
jgi:ferredoxin